MFKILRVTLALGFVVAAGSAFSQDKQDKAARCQNYCQKACANSVGTYKTVCAQKCVTSCLAR
jgi:hypothetical protein